MPAIKSLRIPGKPCFKDYITGFFGKQHIFPKKWEKAQDNLKNALFTNR